jgi:hypothetical protein
MKRHLKVVFGMVVALIFTGASFAREKNFNCDSIPEALKKNANAVVRDSHEEILIKSGSEIYITRRIAITILNEKGKSYGALSEWYDAFRKIEHIDGFLYDKNGDEIERLKQKSINDIGSIGHEFLNDYRAKTFEFHYATYPYTCEYEITTRLDYSFHIPPWEPKEGYDCSVERAELTVVYPKEFSLRYRALHIQQEPVFTAEDNLNKLTLIVNEMKAGSKPDEFSRGQEYYLPTLIFAADKFEFDEMKGSMATWNDFGEFMYRLNANRDELSPAMQELVHNMTDTCKSDMGKIRILYEYLKKNTRYVAIELGIGGWQAFDARFVAEKSYGDCKALSNYMKSLLKAVGIKAYMVLVYGGEMQRHIMMPDFPCNEFNHAILCVPQKDDTIWLECTSKTLPAGYLSSFTANRSVLLITPDGGYPVRTPEYTIRENTARRSADIYIDEKGEMKGTINTMYTGYLWDREERQVVNMPKSEANNYLNRKFTIPNYVVDNYTINNDISGKIPYIRESVSITGNGSVSKSGNNLFLNTAILPLAIPHPESYEPRKAPFHISHSYMICDTLIFHLSGHYSMGSSNTKKIECPFSNYDYKAVLENDSTLKVTALYAQAEGDYYGGLFNAYIQLSKEINGNAARDKIILTKKD